jgi:hypothetical protein
MYKSNKYKHMIKKALLVQINLVCMNVTTVMLLSQQIIRLNQTEYEKQVILCHDEKIAYPSTEDLKKII